MGDTYKASGKPRQSSSAMADAYNAAQDFMRATREKASPTGNNAEDSQLAESNSSNQASTAGRAAQSTDAANQY